MYVIFFDNKGPALKIPVLRGKTVIAKFYRNVAIRKLKKLKKINQIRHPKTGLKQFRLLHDNAEAHEAPIVTEFLESEKFNVPLTPLLPDLAPCD